MPSKERAIKEEGRQNTQDETNGSPKRKKNDDANRGARGNTAGPHTQHYTTVDRKEQPLDRTGQLPCHTDPPPPPP
jgi:hypothetical protein